MKFYFFYYNRNKKNFCIFANETWSTMIIIQSKVKY